MAAGSLDPHEWRVAEARFETSAPTSAAAPHPDRPEFAVVGRSNSGKSSLLNALAGRQGLARTSAAPGRTQLLNFFALSLVRGPQRVEVRCADLPGYGYAAVPTRVRDGFAPMIEPYLLERPTLRVLLVLVDARRGPDDRDVAMIEYVADRPVEVIVVGTKADKLGASERGLWTKAVADELGLPHRGVLLTSARTKDGLGGRGGLVPELARRLVAEPP